MSWCCLVLRSYEEQEGNKASSKLCPSPPRRERPRTGRIERRSIEVSDYSGIDPIRVTRIIDDCASYSDRRPYGWFGPREVRRFRPERKNRELLVFDGLKGGNAKAACLGRLHRARSHH